VQVRSAEPRDAAALRDLHIETWIATYHGQLPESFYQERLATHRMRDWAELVRSQTELGGGVLITGAGECISGLCQYGSIEDDGDDPSEVGQIDRLYIHPLHQRMGLGRSLLTEATRRLEALGMSAVTLWALEADERARAFYERLGWRLDGASNFDGAIDVRYRLALHSQAPDVASRSSPVALGI
jgi:GNAT superfamily N-acetyltransferase